MDKQYRENEMTGFVKTNHTGTPTHKVKNTAISFEEFKRALLERGVCPIGMSNAQQWYSEVPTELMGAYLRKRDHRVPDALLHSDALELVRDEAGIAQQHPFTI